MSGAPETYRCQVTFSITGRIRFLSHLETVDTIVSAVRRSGLPLALSQGMKPKPMVRMAMPRPVAAEAWADVVEIDLTDERDPNEVALAVSGKLPEGITIHAVEPVTSARRSCASRVAGATFRFRYPDEAIALAGGPPRWVATYLAADQITVHRKTPKQDRMVDVRDAVTLVAAVEDEPTVRAYIPLLEGGSAKPLEVVEALAQVTAEDLPRPRLIRESITFSDADGMTVEPELVGADVPEGPARPWGSC